MDQPTTFGGHQPEINTALRSKFMTNGGAKSLTRSGASADERQRELWMRDGRVPADYPGRAAADFPDLLDIVRRLVKPERTRLSGNATAEGRKKKWWLYGRDGKALYHAIGRGRAFARHPDAWADVIPIPERVFACSLVSKHLAVGVCHPETAFAHRLAVFALSDWANFAFLCSSINDAWARKNSSSLESRLNYSPSDAFDTLPRAIGGTTQLAALGERFHQERSAHCTDTGAGLTELYNAIHDPSRQGVQLASLRTLLADIDCAVLATYGWSDLDPAHGFHEVTSLPANDRMRYTISGAARLEVLRRLSALNRQRIQEEQDHAASLAAAQELLESPSPRRRGRQPRASGTSAQPDMFG